METGSQEDTQLLDELVKALLTKTRTSIEEGNRDAALAAILHAIRFTRGEDSIISVIDAVKRRIDEKLAHESHASSTAVAERALEHMLATESLLLERGDEDILQDAFEDGSSVICSMCRALIPLSRSTAHREMWCTALEDTNNSFDEEDNVA